MLSLEKEMGFMYLAHKVTRYQHNYMKIYILNLGMGIQKYCTNLLRSMLCIQHQQLIGKLTEIKYRIQ